MARGLLGLLLAAGHATELLLHPRTPFLSPRSLSPPLSSHFWPPQRARRSTTVENPWPTSSSALATLPITCSDVVFVKALFESSRASPGVVVPFTGSPPAAEIPIAEIRWLRSSSAFVDTCVCIRVSYTVERPLSCSLSWSGSGFRRGQSTAAAPFVLAVALELGLDPLLLSCLREPARSTHIPPKPHPVPILTTP